MTAPSSDDQMIADVKCYFCGHISGQIVGVRGAPLRPSSFVPRPGYAGPKFKPGTRLRCERCQGPVFLEDATPMAKAEGTLSKTLDMKKGEPKRRRAAA